MRSASVRCCLKLSKAFSISVSVLAVTKRICTPSARAACSASPICNWALAFSGSQVQKISCIGSQFVQQPQALPSQQITEKVAPVILPPVRLRLGGIPIHVRSTSNSDHKFDALASVAMCQSTKSLRDSQRPRRLTATLSPGARSWVAGEAPCLEDRGVSNLSLKTGVAYDNQGYHPAASAYDRRYECAQALCWHAEGPHPQLQAVRGVSEAITRHGYMRGYPRLPAASGRHGDEHL